MIIDFDWLKRPPPPPLPCVGIHYLDLRTEKMEEPNFDLNFHVEPLTEAELKELEEVAAVVGRRLANMNHPQSPTSLTKQ